MKKKDLAALALMGLASGLLVGCQPQADASTGNPMDHSSTNYSDSNMMGMNADEAAFYNSLGYSAKQKFMEMNSMQRQQAMRMAGQQCKGMNDCKGMGGCKTTTHSCKGMNSCKGQGGCKAGQQCKGMNDCKGMGGCKTTTHSCKGMNSCKGQGECKVKNNDDAVMRMQNGMDMSSGQMMMQQQRPMRGNAGALSSHRPRPSRS